MTRQKTVFGTHAQTAHVWAQNNVPYGFSSDRRMNFREGVIYSYGDHFPIARFFNPNMIFFTSEGYSPSTGKHKNHVWRAIDRTTKQVFDVPDVMAQDNGAHARNLKHFRTQYEAVFKSQLRRVKFWESEEERKSRLLTSLQEIKINFIAYAEATRQDAQWDELEGPFPLFIPDIDADYIEAERAKRAARNNDPATIAKREKERARRKVREQEKILEKIEAWRNGDTHYVDRKYDGPLLMRLIGDDIQTSLGARFPIEHGKRAFAFIRQCRESHKEWRANGKTIALGHFGIDIIDAFGNVKAGCHYMEWPEIERMARLLEIYP